MMSTRFPQLIVLVFSVLAVACNTSTNTNIKNFLSINSTGFGDQITEKQNLTFIFNQQVVTKEELNKWDDNQWLLFDPPIKGAYRWEKSNQLVFSPNSGFMPNTLYKVVLNEKLNVEKWRIDQNYSTTFSTPKLKVKDATAVWQLKDANSNESELLVHLNFNYEVKPTSFQNISTNIDGENYTTEITNTTFSKQVKLKTDVPQSVGKDAILKINLGNVYDVVNAANNDNAELATTVKIPEPGELTISGHTVEHNGTLGEIYINTNQTIEAAGLKNFITLSPEIDYQIESSGNSIRIFSNDFDISSSYSVTVKKGLKGVLSKGLENEYTTQFAFGYIEPSIKFLNERNRYLSSAGSKNVAVEIVNVNKVNVKITKVFANNIKALLNEGKDHRYHSERNEETGRYDYYNYELYKTKELGKTIFEKKINTNELEAVGKLRLLKLNFEDILDDFNGIYIVEVSDPEKRYLTSSQIVSLSDIGIISKAGKDAVYVFLNSIKTTQPIAGATVTLFDQTNQKLISRPSDGEGVVQFRYSEINMIDPVVHFVEAKTTTDFNFLSFKQSQMNSSRFEIGGLRNHESEYLAYLYGERELYRPGETIKVAGIVRTNAIEQPNEIPVVVKCLLPNGKIYKTINKKLNAQGAFETSVEIPATAPTGSYTFELLTGNNIFIKSHPIKVEAFMPDRIKLTTKTNETVFQNGDKVQLDLEAVNYFGPPAKNRKYETEFSISRSYFSPKDFSDYTFAIKHDNNQLKFDPTLEEGTTDEEGKGNTQFDIPAHFQKIGLLRGRIFTTVFDESGRPVSKSNYFDIFTQEVFFGLKRFNYYTNTGQNMMLNFVALDKDENLLNKQSMLVQIERSFYKTVLEKDNRGRYRYKSYKEQEIVAEETITLNGENGTFNFAPEETGSYKVKYGHPQNLSEYQFYAYGRGNTNFTAFEVNKEGKITFKKDQDQYKVGDQANLILSTPFQGKVLVTIERDDIIKHYYTSTDKRTAELRIDITPDMFPNAYVTATLIKPVDDTNSPLTVAYGIENLTVAYAEKSIPIMIEAEDKIRSNQAYTFTVSSEPNTEMTIAVVDEGILNITNYESPDASNHFYQKRALQVNAYDLYPYLFPELTDRGLLIGGGSIEELNNRAVGFGNKRVQLCSYWSGIVQTNDEGLYEMTIDVPEFSGDLRIMAMNYNDDRFGATQANIKVADPIVMSAGLPRFLTPGDVIDIPVMLSNTTDKALQNEVTIEVDGPLELLSDAKQSIDIAANNEQKVLFKAKVLNTIGEARVNISTQAGNETFNSNTTLQVRPASPLQKLSGSGIVKANTEETLNLSSDNEFIESSVKGNLILTQSPIAEFGDKLTYLLKYPHGCLEQKVSKVFPLVHATDLLKTFNVTLDSKTQLNPDHLIQTVIYDIQTLQTSNGGMAYWPRNSKVQWWGSVYAAHFLSETKKAGYDVNPAILNKLLNYIKEKNRTKETKLYSYKDDVKKETVRREIPYGLFVLALAGEPDIALMNYYKSYPKLLTDDAKYMLGAAYAMLGDVDKFRAMVPPSFSGEKAAGEFDGSFSSYIRDLAVALYALVEVEPDNPQIPLITQQLSKAYKERRYFNTQEAAFTVLALGKVAKLNQNNAVEAEVFAGDKLVATFTGENDVQLDYGAYKDEDLRIVAKGSGQLYYFYEVSGFSNKNEVTERDNFLEVRKAFYDRDGNKVKLNDVQQNDLIVVELALRSKFKTVPNVVLTDVLPAGFEIENPRINETATIAWQKHQGTYDHIDFRDDRVNIYTTAYPSSRNSKSYKNYYYMVRAVSKGDFIMGPASADSMYNGEYYSYSGGGKVKIN